MSVDSTIERLVSRINRFGINNPYRAIKIPNYGLFNQTKSGFGSWLQQTKMLPPFDIDFPVNPDYEDNEPENAVLIFNTTTDALTALFTIKQHFPQMNAEPYFGGVSTVAELDAELSEYMNNWENLDSPKSRVIELTPQCIEARLGDVIFQYLTSEEVKQIYSARISVANDTWYGLFLVPEAIGFSTPVSLLQGGRLSLNLDPEHTDNTFYDKFWQWSNIYSGVGVRRVTDQVISTDKLTCAICSTAYVNSDVVRQLNSCNHMFHKKCLEQLVVRSCEVCLALNRTSYEFHDTHTAHNLSSEAVACPICRTKTYA